MIIFATYEVYRSIHTIHDTSSYVWFNTLTVMSITMVRCNYNINSTISIVWICPSGHPFLILTVCSSRNYGQICTFHGSNDMSCLVHVTVQGWKPSNPLWRGLQPTSIGIANPLLVEHSRYAAEIAFTYYLASWCELALSPRLLLVAFSWVADDSFCFIFFQGHWYFGPAIYSRYIWWCQLETALSLMMP